MTTSGTYSISFTAGQIIDMILMELGVLGASQSANGADSDLVKNKMNLWLIQQNGLNNVIRSGDMMWSRETATITLETTKYVYELKPSGGDVDIQIPSEIIAAVWRDATDDTDIPLSAMNLREYSELNDKFQSAQPLRYYYEKRLDVGNFYIDCYPQSAEEIVIWYKQPVELITTRDETFDLDPSWYRALLYNVAKDCAGPFGLGIDSPIYQGIASNAAESMLILNSFFPNNHTIQIRPGR